MSKPKAIQWLEEQAGQTIDYRAEVSQDRHLSVRLTKDLTDGLDAMAAERSMKLFHLVRELLTEAVSHRASVT